MWSVLLRPRDSEEYIVRTEVVQVFFPCLPLPAGNFVPYLHHAFLRAQVMLLLLQAFETPSKFPKVAHLPLFVACSFPA